MNGMRKKFTRFLALVTAYFIFLPTITEAAGTITLNPSTTFERSRGWEALCYAGQEVDGPAGGPIFNSFINPLLDRNVNELGINRLRLEVRSGVENDTAHWQQYVDTGDYDIWRANRYITVNDNADPFVINPAGFHFEELNWNIENIAQPLRTRLANRGETLYTSLCYVAFIEPGPDYIHDNADEYAEFIVATFQHMDNAYGWTPDALEIFLEPDLLPTWSGGYQVGQAIVAVGSRLQAVGYTPDIIAPSVTNMDNHDYVQGIFNVPGVLQYITGISYHAYGGDTPSNRVFWNEQAQVNGLYSGMLELWDQYNTVDMMLTHFEDMSQTAMWELAGLGDNYSATISYYVDATNPSQPVISLNPEGRLFAQYFRYVRWDALRIAASSDNGNLRPLAWINENGNYAVIVRAYGQENITVTGLPSGIYGVNYALEGGGYNIDLPDITVDSSGVLTTAIQAPGVISVYEKSSPSAVPISFFPVWLSGGLVISVGVFSLRKKK
jgi:hypothetical protein